MKQLDALRKVIREEVRKAIKDELSEVLQEAVKVASKPTTQQEVYSKPVNTETMPSSGVEVTDPVQAMLEQTRKELHQGLAESIQLDNKAGMEQSWNSVTPMRTQAMANQLGMTGTQPGLDLTKLDFVKRAAKIVNHKKSI